MKAIIRRDRETGKIVYDLGEYERLAELGKTDAEIAEMAEQFNEKSKEHTAELIELDEVAQFYKEQQEKRRAEKFADLEIIAERLQDLACELDGVIRRMKR